MRYRYEEILAAISTIAATSALDSSRVCAASNRVSSCVKISVIITDSFLCGKAEYFHTLAAYTLISGKSCVSVSKDTHNRKTRIAARL